MYDTPEYKAIADFYGPRCAARSGVPLINHIQDGLVVLEAIQATDAAKRAYCLHPLFQANQELLTVGAHHAWQGSSDAYAVMLAMEYRQWANAYLSDKVTPDGRPYAISRPHAGPLVEVRDMLIADKVQNFKDFETYHKATHPKSKQLQSYFSVWLYELGINEARYKELCSLIDTSRAKRVG